MKASNLARSQESNNSAYSKRIPRDVKLLVLFYFGSGFVQQTVSLLHVQLTSVKLDRSVSRMAPLLRKRLAEVPVCSNLLTSKKIT